MIEAIIIGMGLLLVIVVVIAIAKGGDVSPRTSQFTELPDGEKYVEKNAQIPHYDGDLADKVDARFTNIGRNPWKGIL